MVGWSSHDLLRRIALFARRRYRLVFALALVLMGASLLLARRLAFDTDVLALLPREEAAVRTYREALEEFGSVDHLLIVVHVPEGALLEPYETFAGELGERLERSPDFLEVEYRIAEVDELLRTLLPHAPLFLEQRELARLEAALGDGTLRRRAGELKRLISTPQSLAVKELIKLDPAGLAPILLDRFAGARSGLALDWSSGHLLSRDHRMLLVLAKPRRPPQDVDFSAAMVAGVERRIEELTAAWPQLVGPEAPLPRVELGGRHLIGLGDAEIIRRDALTGILTSGIGVLLLFLFAFRRLGALAYAFLPLAFGLVLTFGFAAASYGKLSSATSGIAALLIGLGIDFVILSYGRYVEERRRGGGLEEGLAKMSGSSGRAVVVGAVTSAATFYAFGVTDFPGLYQMGWLTGTGILFCMVGVLLLLPAMLAWSEDHGRRRRRIPRLFLHGLGSGRLIRLAFARPRTTLAAGAALTVLAAAAAVDLRFEDSVQSMRPRGNPAFALREEVAARFGLGFDQMMLIVEAPTLDELLELVDRAAERSRRLVERGVLRGVDDLGVLLPPVERQRRSLAWLAERRGGALDGDRIRSTLREALTAEGLRWEPFAEGVELLDRALRRSEPIGVAEIEAMPQAGRLLERYLRRTEDGWKSAVYLHPPPHRWRREPPPAVEALAASLGPSVVLTGANVVSELLREQVLDDALLAAAVGFVAVGLLLWLDYRRLSAALVTLVPLVIGIVWMLGGMALLDLPMNFMNVFVGTMIIGIGVDYGIHIVHRWRELRGRPRPELEQGLVDTGKAIALAALSTTLGFGSLWRSSYPGLSSMGVVAILGALSTCVVAITVLPAWIAIRSRSAPGGSASGWSAGAPRSGRPSG